MNPKARLQTVSAALILSAGLLFAGCATNDPSTRNLSHDEFREFYPRQYYDSLDPFERNEAEHRMIEREYRRSR